MAGVTMPLASLSLASFFHWPVPQDSAHFLFLQYTPPDLQPPVNSSYALLSEEVQQGGRGNPKKVGALLHVWGSGGHVGYRQLFLQFMEVPGAQVQHLASFL